MTQYYYLISSLHILEFGRGMPFAYTDFLTLCNDQLDRCDMEVIKRTSIAPSEDVTDIHHMLKDWERFDTTLRNEIVRFRAKKISKDPAQYIHREDYRDPNITNFAQWVTNLDSPLEAEISLDRYRWERIEELGKGYYFDIGYLITYALKLQILERWQRINSEEGKEILEGLIRDKEHGY